MAANRTATTGPRLVEYSPTAAQVLRFCQKKYYFRWLMRRRQGWRKPPEHPWRQVYELAQVKHRPAWAGDLYHQVIGYVLSQVRRSSSVDESAARQLAWELAERQFAFSAGGGFAGATKSRVASFAGLPTFLALFEHVYGLPADGALEDTRSRVDTWLANTFAWEGWPTLLAMVRLAQAVYVEPQHLSYTMAGTRLTARMDLGIESRDGHFMVYDWKCHREDHRFLEHEQRLFRRQLLAYALWPVRREVAPLPLDRVSAHIFNPVSVAHQELRFTEEDDADFELEVERWARVHAQLFTDVPDVEFEDLNGPYDSQRSCPGCPLKRVCGQEIAWHELT